MTTPEVHATTSIWTAFITALVALLTSMGLTRAATAVARRTPTAATTTAPAAEAIARQEGVTARPDLPDGGVEHRDGPVRTERSARPGLPGLPDQRDRRRRTAAGPDRKHRRARSERTERAERRASRARARAAAPAVPAQSTRWSPGSRTRSLPPTIKQRIRAEAHNASPSVRKLPVLDPVSLDSGVVSIGARGAKDFGAAADRSLLTTAA
ncbi:DUF6344 domain-containing protein [Streptomyces sp. NPDC020141]|uniref:DUF6344 domain-containing protein n=1 Tax=Streptomyces sp. NPDC020141 TaxID=3365065 RepID=UPI0037B1C244